MDYNNEQTKWANEVMRGLYPEELGGKSDEEIWAVGSNTVLTMTTPIIEVAFDGQTAKGMWYVFGETTEVYSKGPKAAWNFGKCSRGLHQGGRRVEDLAHDHVYRHRLPPGAELGHRQDV